MKSQYRVSGLLVVGFLVFAAGTPSSALTEDGKNLLERLRGRIEAKEAAAAKPVETVAPPVEFKTQTPPAPAFEPGSIVTDPSRDEPKKAGAKKPRKSSDSRGKKPRVTEEMKAEVGKQQKDAAKPLPRPSAPPVVPAVSVATNTDDTVSVAQQAQPAAGSARRFGELSDAELIQYAQEHMWTEEKSRKHNPPWTPPSKPKKKKGDKQKADATSTKSGSKKTGTPQTKAAATKGKS